MRPETGLRTMEKRLHVPVGLSFRGGGMARKKKSQDGDKGRTLYRAKSGCFPRVSGVFVAVMALSIFLVFAISVSGQPVQPYDTPGFIAGTPIPVRQCEDGARCSGGADCMNGICVNHCNPTSPFCACDCILSGPEPEFPWVVVVGGLAAVAAAAAIISRILKNKPKKKGEPPAEIYILQLSKDNLVVSPKKNDSFTDYRMESYRRGRDVTCTVSIHPGNTPCPCNRPVGYTPVRTGVAHVRRVTEQLCRSGISNSNHHSIRRWRKNFSRYQGEDRVRSRD